MAREKKQTQTLSIRGVTLKGNDSEKEGLHTVHIGRSVAVFRGGKAEVDAELAGKLAELGIVEAGETHEPISNDE